MHVRFVYIRGYSLSVCIVDFSCGCFLCQYNSFKLTTMPDSVNVPPTPKPRQAKLGLNPTLTTIDLDGPGIFNKSNMMHGATIQNQTKSELLEEIRRLQEENLQLTQEKQQQQQQERQQQKQRRQQSDFDDCKFFPSQLNKTFSNFELNEPYVPNTPGYAYLNSATNSCAIDSLQKVHDEKSNCNVSTNSILNTAVLNSTHDIYNFCNNTKSDVLAEQKDIFETIPKHVNFENPNSHKFNAINNDVIMPTTFNSLSDSQLHSKSPRDIGRLESQLNELLRWKQTFAFPQNFAPPQLSQQHYSRRDIRRDNFRPINSNDLASSLNYFELELSLHNLESDSEKLRAAALVFPQTIVEGYQCLYPEVSKWKYSDFRNYILNKLPQHYSCHMQHNFSSSPSLLELDNIASKDTACPKDELYKFFMIYRAPVWARDQIRKHVRLHISQFKEKVDDILTSGGHDSVYKPFTHRGFNSGHPRATTAQSSLCTYHTRFGRNALTCTGPACPMYSANLRISSRPQQPQYERNNQGNE